MNDAVSSTPLWVASTRNVTSAGAKTRHPRPQGVIITNDPDQGSTTSMMRDFRTNLHGNTRRGAGAVRSIRQGAACCFWTVARFEQARPTHETPVGVFPLSQPISSFVHVACRHAARAESSSPPLRRSAIHRNNCNVRSTGPGCAGAQRASRQCVSVGPAWTLGSSKSLEEGGACWWEGVGGQSVWVRRTPTGGPCS